MLSSVILLLFVIIFFFGGGGGCNRRTQMGFSRDFKELCAVVKKRDSKSTAFGKLKMVLENLCEAL